MNKNILLGLSGSVACSKSEIFYKEYSKYFNFKFISTYSGLKYLSKEFIKENKSIF